MQDYEKFKQIYVEIDELIKNKSHQKMLNLLHGIQRQRDLLERNTENIQNSRRFRI